MRNPKDIKSTASSDKKIASVSKKPGNPKLKPFLGGLKNQLGIIIAIFVFALYAQSISFNYALDDYGVLKGNKLVEQGIKGIPEILKTDRLYGSEANKNNRTFEYRPVSIVVFALGWQFFPDKPFFFHLITVLFYAFSCWFLFQLLCKLFNNYNLIIPLGIALLFASHPIHTEVVDNIKSLDEILCFLFGLFSIYSFVLFIEKKSILHFVMALIYYFISLLSKETGITFLIIIPLTLYVFTSIKLKEILLISGGVVFISTIYLLIRSNVLAAVPVTNIELAYFNSLYTAPDFISRESTAFYILLKYVWLLLFPIQLSYDYSISQIPNQSLSSPLVIFAILIFSAMGIYAVYRIKQKDVISFSILIFLIALAPVSNIFLLIRSTMAERFLYIPSLGFCIIVVFIIVKLVKPIIRYQKIQTIKQLFSSNLKFVFIIIALTLVYSIRVLSRNPDWKDNYTLFSHDIDIVTDNARAHYNYGNTLLYKANLMTQDKEKQDKLLNTAIQQFVKALTIFNNIPNANADLAKAYFLKNEYPAAISNYEIAINNFLSPDPESYSNLGLLYTRTGQYQKALKVLNKATTLNPKYTDARINRTSVYLKTGRYADAINECSKVLEYDTKNEKAFVVKGIAYLNLKQYGNALNFLKTALLIDSTDINCINLLGATYLNVGDTIKAKQYFVKATELTNKK